MKKKILNFGKGISNFINIISETIMTFATLGLVVLSFDYINMRNGFTWSLIMFFVLLILVGLNKILTRANKKQDIEKEELLK